MSKPVVALGGAGIEAQLSNRQTVTYPPHVILFTQHDIGHSVYYLLDGLVELAYFGRFGDQTVLCRIKPGHFFGEAGALLHKPHQVTAVTIERSRLYAIPVADAISWVQDAPELAEALLVSLSEKALGLARNLCTRVFNDARGMVASQLLELLPRHTGLERPGAETVSLTQEQLALLAGLSRVSVSRALQALQEQGVVRVRRGGVEVGDLAELRRLAQP